VIRINLLGVERVKARKAPAFDSARRVTAACSLILVAAAGGVGFWFWSLKSEAASLTGQIEAAQREAARLRTVLAEVEQFEARRSQLQERVGLIEELRSGQGVPVQLLDHISRSMPEMLWLTSMQQDGASLEIQGRSTTLIGLSDFVGNLGTSPLLAKPIEIVDSQVEAEKGSRQQAATELIKFTVKAQLAPTGKAKDVTPARGSGPAKGRAAAGRGQGAGA
jgi:type IV pilus assembly protein PilN